MKTFFEKTKYYLLVESATTENATFSYKTAASKFNFKICRRRSRKWTDYNVWSFATNCSIVFFFENSISVKETHKNS